MAHSTGFMGAYTDVPAPSEAPSSLVRVRETYEPTNILGAWQECTRHVRCAFPSAFATRLKGLQERLLGYAYDAHLPDLSLL